MTANILTLEKQQETTWLSSLILWSYLLVEEGSRKK